MNAAGAKAFERAREVIAACLGQCDLGGLGVHGIYPSCAAWVTSC